MKINTKGRIDTFMCMVMSYLFVSLLDYGEERALNEHMERCVMGAFLHQLTKALPVTERQPTDKRDNNV